MKKAKGGKKSASKKQGHRARKRTMAKVVNGSGIIDISDGFAIEVFPDTIPVGRGNSVLLMVANHMDAAVVRVRIDGDRIEVGGKRSGRRKNPLSGPGMTKVDPHRAELLELKIKKDADIDVYSYTIEAFDNAGAKKGELDPDLDVIDPGAIRYN